MEFAQLAEIVRAKGNVFRETGATAVYAFGSRARGDHRPDSDLDLFIDFDPERKIPNFFAIIDLEFDLADETGLPVTITTRGSLHPRMRERIEHDAVQII